MSAGSFSKMVLMFGLNGNATFEQRMFLQIQIKKTAILIKKVVDFFQKRHSYAVWKILST